MKKLYILFLISLITSNLFSITKSENANYYLYNGQKVYLNIDKKKAEERRTLFYKRFKNIIPYTKTFYTAKLLW